MDDAQFGSHSLLNEERNESLVSKAFVWISNIYKKLFGCQRIPESKLNYLQTVVSAEDYIHLYTEP